MTPFSEYFWWLWSWISCYIPFGICDGQQIGASLALTDLDIAAISFLSLSGLLFWLLILVRLLRLFEWHLFSRWRNPTLEELLAELKRTQDKVQRDYLLKLLNR